MKDDLLQTLVWIENVLCLSQNFGQAKIVNNIITALTANKINDAYNALNGVDMWGGAGAVWEVYIPDKRLEIEFKNSIIALIDVMEKNSLLQTNFPKRLSSVLAIKELFLKDGS